MAGLGLPKPVKFQLPGTPVNQSVSTVISAPGGTQTMLSYTVPVGSVATLYQAVVVTRAFTAFRVSVDGVLAGSGKTNTVENNAGFTWSAGFVCTAGQQVLFTIVSRSDTPQGIDVEAYLQMTVTGA